MALGLDCGHQRVFFGLELTQDTEGDALPRVPMQQVATREFLSVDRSQ